MAKQSSTDATDSALGYYFQAIYSLILLLGADDDATVSVETQDDVVLAGTVITLHQLKHSAGTPGTLTEKDLGLWKTLGIWMRYVSDPKYLFAFVTCAKLTANNDLAELRGIGDRKNAVTLLEREAERVLTEVAKARADRQKTKSKEPLPYRDRSVFCETFLNLNSDERKSIVDRTTLLDGNFNVHDLPNRVEAFLTNFPKDIRHQMGERLIEWWDRRVARSLCNLSDRQIGKDELQAKIQSLVVEHADDNLPDDFSSQEPTDLKPELGTAMERQIRLVDGGGSRIIRAAVARWRAREQRARWLNQNIGIQVDLQKFDDALIAFWNDRHGPMCDDSAKHSADQKKLAGRSLLDWSHVNAHLEVPRPRPKWVHAFLTQGMYQQFADQLEVGWHPEFKTLIVKNPKKEPPKKHSKRSSKKGS